MHSLLRQQLLESGIDLTQLHNIPPETWLNFLDRVEHSYQQRLAVEPRAAQAGDRLQAIASALPDLLFLQDENGVYLEVYATSNDPNLYRPEAQILGKTPYDLFPEQQARQFMGILRKTLESQRTQSIEYELDVPAGRRIFEARLTPTEIPLNRHKTVIVLVRDITDKVHAEIRQQLASTVFEASHEGMVIMDGQRKVLSVNSAFHEITGLTQDEVVDKDPDFLHAAYPSNRLEDIWGIVSVKGRWHGEINGRRARGEIYPLWLTLDTVRDKQGRITHFVALMCDISEIKRSQQELEYVANHDPLTNLPNRHLFHNQLEEALHRSKRNRRLGALFFLDLDRFKQINDNLGHHIGDQLLIDVAERLKSLAREEDLLARLGGDEFTLIIENLSHAEDAAKIAKKIICSFAVSFRLDDYELEITTSIGISLFPTDGTEIEKLVKQADTAMYAAKEAGRNTFHFYTHQLTDNAFEFFSLEMKLKKALERQEFSLVFQPQYELSSGRMIGVEALIRWHHHELGLVLPEQFIPLAEVCGLIEPIGHWVIQAACRQAAQWDRLQLKPIPISINVSRRQLVSPHIVNDTRQALAEHGLSGDRLELEITESTFFHSEEQARHNLEQLRSLGCNIAIDDFGTGYSSLANLKGFPLDRLKIDKSFIQELDQDPSNEKIIRATIALGTSLQLQVIAEGVESEAQRTFLLAEGCKGVQGNLFSLPLSAEQVAKLIHEEMEFERNLSV
jgi:diguanylate cyclase (GGDEF)-like protein/PAS domain S-box-containing protein